MTTEERLEEASKHLQDSAAHHGSLARERTVSGKTKKQKKDVESQVAAPEPKSSLPVAALDDGFIYVSVSSLFVSLFWYSAFVLHLLILSSVFRLLFDFLSALPEQNEADKVDCKLCKVTMSNTKFVIERHFKSKSHKKGKIKLCQASTESEQLMKFLSTPNAVPLIPYPNLDSKVTVFRLRFLDAWLRTGAPLHEADEIRSFVEANAYGMDAQLTASSHLARYIPLLSAFYHHNLTDELAGEALALAFDGASSFSDTIVINAHWLDCDLFIHTRLLLVKLLDHSPNSDILGTLLNQLCGQLHTIGSRVFTTSHDSAAVNNEAGTQVGRLNPDLGRDLRCLPHLIDGVGKKMNLPTLKEFQTHWRSLFAFPCNAQAAFRKRFPKERLIHHNNTRYSRSFLLFFPPMFALFP
jgi:hypothetical protein